MEEVYRSYYTKSDSIVSYMLQKLSVGEGMTVFEPCAGDGVFIDRLNDMEFGVSIDAYELNPKAVELLKEKYRDNKNIKITHSDMLTNDTLLVFSNMGRGYDRIIANPPYGGWIDYDRRKQLKRLYPVLYVKETYTLFLYLCVQLLRDKGILVFIIPDTFLNLHMHIGLRRFLLTNTKIGEICLFPSSFFPNVNFGYSNLCIITLQRCHKEKECLDNDFKVITGFRNVTELGNLNQFPVRHHRAFSFKQREIYENFDSALFVSENPKITDLINNCAVRVGDIADCVTGFYSGNDKKHLRPISENIKNAKKYRLIDKSQICYDYLLRENILEGITDSNYFVSIVKGGGIKYFKPDLWYMDWSVESVKGYKASKRARFQNSKYYFKYGIGVPMVSSTQITAALIENKLFDQSIVGIFPENRGLVYYLLAFFNSSTCNRLIRTINPSANNPSNYIKKIPFILPSDNDLKEINRLTQGIVCALKEGKEYPESYEQILNELVEKVYGF
ncbi:N-6 DNA methylase [Candidatus Poribacteria bacterium]|nr:N-6 DNA methylase [Candidatus Poribacteria bacterium]